MKRSVFSAMAMVTQFGIGIITPMLLCIFAALWLKSRFALGDWVVLIGVFFGMGSGFLSMLKMIRQMSELSKKEDEDDSRNEKTA